MKKLLLLILSATSLFAANQFDRLVDKFESGDTVKLYKPSTTMALSLIPGGGQYYTHHFARGSMFLGTELLMGSQTALRYKWYTYAKDGRERWSKRYDSLSLKLRTKLDTISVTNKTEIHSDSVQVVTALYEKKLREFEADRAKIDFVNWAGWFGGIYAWNLIDGLGCSNQFKGVENPSPKRAALLSMIPFTGAGQFYNGSFKKGAMVSVVQLGCMYSAINFHQIAKKAKQYDKELIALPDSAYNMLSPGDRKSWEGKSDAARRSQTMFMWYGVIFYLYGMADAAVDAHMYDFENHFKITSGVDPIDGRISFALTGNFGRSR